MNINDGGGPAFPQPIAEVDGTVFNASEYSPKDAGMTRRQWFAGMAMQGILAADPALRIKPDVIASWAYEQADAMLAHEAMERGEKETTNAND